MTDASVTDLVTARLSDQREWFADARFGIFVHFGLYALAGINENDRGDLTPSQYAQRYMPQFNPTAFDARQWVRAFVDAGARYMVMTTRHGDGFCLWHTQQTDFNIANTPFGRDIIAELAEAAREADLRLGLYYATDNWYYPPDGDAPQSRDFPAFVEGQLSEILTNYGRIDALWFDGADPRLGLKQMRSLIAMAHSLQPGCVVNDRGVDFSTHRDVLLGDFVTPERHVPDYLAEAHPFVEVCDSMGRTSWGYCRDDPFWSTSTLINRLTRSASLGANYLLNVQPQPDGAIRPECTARLAQIGHWMSRHHHAVIGTQACPVIPLDLGDPAAGPIGCATRRDDVIYLHLSTWPTSDQLAVDHLLCEPASVRLVGHDDADLPYARQDGRLTIRALPPVAPGMNPVIALHFDRPPQLDYAAIEAARRPVAAVQPDRSTHLSPDEAYRHAPSGVPRNIINRFANGRRSIGHNTRLDCGCTWHLDVNEAGDYRIAADLGNNHLQADALFTLSVGKSSVKHRTVENGWYDTPHRYQLGTLTLPAGRCELVLRIEEMPNCFSDVHGIIIEPAIR